MNNTTFDRTIRKSLIDAQTIAASMTLLAVSPGSEHLLWLPYLICSAYRQKMLFKRNGLFDAIVDLTHVAQLP